MGSECVPGPSGISPAGSSPAWVPSGVRGNRAAVRGHCAEVECADWNPILQALQYGVAGAGGTAGAEVSSSCATWSPLMQRFSNGWSI